MNILSTALETAGSFFGTCILILVAGVSLGIGLSGYNPKRHKDE